MSKFDSLFNFRRTLGGSAGELEQVLEARAQLAKVAEREAALIRMLREQLYINVLLDRTDDLQRRVEELERAQTRDRPGRGGDGEDPRTILPLTRPGV